MPQISHRTDAAGRALGLLALFCLALLVFGVASAGAPAIMVDGYADDWAGVEPVFEDPEGDAEDGFLDLTNVSTYADASGLYFLAKVADPLATLVQFDLEIRVGDRSFLLSVGKHGGAAVVAEVTEGYVQIGDTLSSSFAFGAAWEGFISFEDLPVRGEISLADIRVMVGECCGDEWRPGDDLEAEAHSDGLAFHPVQRTDDPAAYAGQGMSWTDAGMRLRSLPGYELEHVWASTFALSFQIAGLHDGSIAVGDKERGRILRVAETGVTTLLTEVNAHWMATLPDGRLVYYSRDGSLMALDLETGVSEIFYDLPGIDGYRSPIGVDAAGRVYGIESASRSLIRTTLDGRLEILTGPLPYDQPWHITDIEVAEDGTVYIGGFEHVVAVDPDGEIRTVVDELHYEPVFIDLGPDGTLYVNELAKGFQAYSPATGDLFAYHGVQGFQDFVFFDERNVVFFDSTGSFYHHDLVTGEQKPIARADTLNSGGFAADADGGLYATTGAIAPWGAHIVRLAKDGSFEEYPEDLYWHIHSADVDFSGRLCYVADGSLHRREPDGSISSWDLDLPWGRGVDSTSLACSPDGTWVILGRSDREFRLYLVSPDGEAEELTELRFTQDSFSRDVAVLDDARVDIGPDGRITMIVTARATMQRGPYIQRIYQANADGSGLTEIANMDCQRVAGMVDVAVDAFGTVYALCVTGSTGSGDWIFRIEPGEGPQAVVLINAGRDPRSIDVGVDGTIWFGTTLGVFRAYSAEDD